MNEKDLLGTWQLISHISTPEKGSPYQPFGEKPKGYLFYSTDGMMGVALQSQDRSKILSYFGKFNCDQEQVFHHVEISSIPEWIGTTQIRFFQVKGDNLIIRTPKIKIDEGASETAELRWKKVKQSSS